MISHKLQLSSRKKCENGKNFSLSFHFVPAHACPDGEAYFRYGVCHRSVRILTRGDENGQSMLELALILPMLLLMVLGLVDFGFVFSDRLAVYNGARDGVRYATTAPTAWSSASTPGLNTIEGEVRNAGGTATIVNDDTHIVISYFTTTGALCGRYSAGTNSFVPQSGYTQATCVIGGNFVQVQASYYYPFITPLPAIVNQLFSFAMPAGTTFPTGVNLVSSSTMVEEQ